MCDLWYQLEKYFANLKNKNKTKNTQNKTKNKNKTKNTQNKNTKNGDNNVT